jgi:hypothetical protein
MADSLKPWEVVTFHWGTAVRHRKGEWLRIYLSPYAREINVEDIPVSLSDKGIVFLLK